MAIIPPQRVRLLIDMDGTALRVLALEQAVVSSGQYLTPSSTPQDWAAESILRRADHFLEWLKTDQQDPETETFGGT